MTTFVKRTRIAAPARRVFAWHEAPAALERLVPPWEPVTIDQRPNGLRDGATAILRIGYGPAKLRWVADHHSYEDWGDEGGTFSDVQRSGPFRSWEHRHTVTADGPDACILEDHIEYELPFGFVGRWFGSWIAARKIERMFEYRHRVTREANEPSETASAKSEPVAAPQSPDL